MQEAVSTTPADAANAATAAFRVIDVPKARRADSAKDFFKLHGSSQWSKAKGKEKAKPKGKAWGKAKGKAKSKAKGKPPLEWDDSLTFGDWLDRANEGSNLTMTVADELVWSATDLAKLITLFKEVFPFAAAAFPGGKRPVYPFVNLRGSAIFGKPSAPFHVDVTRSSTGSATASSVHAAGILVGHTSKAVFYIDIDDEATLNRFRQWAAYTLAKRGVPANAGVEKERYDYLTTWMNYGPGKLPNYHFANHGPLFTVAEFQEMETLFQIEVKFHVIRGGQGYYIKKGVPHVFVNLTENCMSYAFDLPDEKEDRRWAPSHETFAVLLQASRTSFLTTPRTKRLPKGIPNPFLRCHFNATLLLWSALIKAGYEYPVPTAGSGLCNKENQAIHQRWRAWLQDVLRKIAQNPSKCEKELKQVESLPTPTCIPHYPAIDASRQRDAVQNFMKILRSIGDGCCGDVTVEEFTPTPDAPDVVDCSKRFLIVHPTKATPFVSMYANMAGGHDLVDSNWGRPGGNFEIPEISDFQFPMVLNDGSGRRFNAVAWVEQYQAQVSHIVAVVKDQRCGWLLFDDSKVSEIKTPTAVGPLALSILYVQDGAESKGPAAGRVKRKRGGDDEAKRKRSDGGDDDDEASTPKRRRLSLPPVLSPVAFEFEGFSFQTTGETNILNLPAPAQLKVEVTVWDKGGLPRARRDYKACLSTTVPNLVNIALLYQEDIVTTSRQCSFSVQILDIECAMLTINFIGIKAQYQKKGHGTRLLRLVMGLVREWLQPRKVVVTLISRPTTGAVHLYERCNFIYIAKSKSHIPVLPASVRERLGAATHIYLMGDFSDVELSQLATRGSRKKQAVQQPPSPEPLAKRPRGSAVEPGQSPLQEHCNVCKVQISASDVRERISIGGWFDDSMLDVLFSHLPTSTGRTENVFPGAWFLRTCSQRVLDVGSRDKSTKGAFKDLPEALARDGRVLLPCNLGDKHWCLVVLRLTGRSKSGGFDVTGSVFESLYKSRKDVQMPLQRLTDFPTFTPRLAKNVCNLINARAR